MLKDVAVTRTKVEAIEQSLSRIGEQYVGQEARLKRVERRVFALWVIGPVLIAAAGLLRTAKTWVME